MGVTYGGLRAFLPSFTASINRLISQQLPGRLTLLYLIFSFQCKQTSASLLLLIARRHEAEQNRCLHDLLVNKTGLNRTAPSWTCYKRTAAIRSSIGATHQLRILVPGAALKVASNLVRHRPYNGLRHSRAHEPQPATQQLTCAVHPAIGYWLLAIGSAVCTCLGRPAHTASHAQHAKAIFLSSRKTRRLLPPQPMQHFHVAGLGGKQLPPSAFSQEVCTGRVHAWLAGDLHVRHHCGALQPRWTIRRAA
jgi:hypothetical protein